MGGSGGSDGQFLEMKYVSPVLIDGFVTMPKLTCKTSRIRSGSNSEHFTVCSWIRFLIQRKTVKAVSLDSSY